MNGKMSQNSSKDIPKIDDNMYSKDYMLKEIDIIQDIIKRMASNSFMIKGWTITLVVITLLFKRTDVQIWIAFIPLIVFWYLDAYFLHQERMYRELYKWVIKNRMNTTENLFNMDTKRFLKDVDSISKTMRSKTLGLFYGSILVLIIILYIVI